MYKKGDPDIFISYQTKVECAIVSKRILGC